MGRDEFAVFLSSFWTNAPSTDWDASSLFTQRFNRCWSRPRAPRAHEHTLADPSWQTHQLDLTYEQTTVLTRESSWTLVQNYFRITVKCVSCRLWPQIQNRHQPEHARNDGKIQSAFTLWLLLLAPTWRSMRITWVPLSDMHMTEHGCKIPRFRVSGA